jgi:hypothetical protein
MRKLVAGSAVLALLVVLVGCGASETKPFATAEVTRDFRLLVAEHIHGQLSASDVEQSVAIYKDVKPGTPVVITGDGKGCIGTTAHHWKCEAYVYMNTVPEVNHLYAGHVTEKGTKVSVEAQVKE